MGRKPNWPPLTHIHRRDNKECVTIAGVHHPLGTPGSDEAKREYARLIGEYAAVKSTSDRPPVSLAKEPLVCELAAMFLSQPRDSADAARAADALEPVLELYGDQPVSRFGPLAFRAARRKLCTPGRSRQYVNRLAVMIRSCWRWGVSHELVAEGQLRAIETVGAIREGDDEAEGLHETEEVMPVEFRIVEATLPFLPARPAAMVRLQMLTGARPSEVCRLRRSEIHADGRVHLPRGKVIDLSPFNMWVFSPANHKTKKRGKERHLLIGPRAQAILAEWLAVESREYLFSPAEEREERFAAKRAKRKSRVQPSQVSRKKAAPKKVPGLHYKPDCYHQHIVKAADAADAAAHAKEPSVPADVRLVPRWFPYQLRHVAATELREEEDLEVAQAVLGHSDAETTLRYALRSFRKAAEVIARIG